MLRVSIGFNTQLSDYQVNPARYDRQKGEIRYVWF